MFLEDLCHIYISCKDTTASIGTTWHFCWKIVFEIFRLQIELNSLYKGYLFPHIVLDTGRHFSHQHSSNENQ